MRGAGDFKLWLHERRYAPDTIEAYLGYTRRFAATLDGTTARRAGPDDIRRFLHTLPPSAASWNQGRKALGAYYKSIGRRPNPVDDVEPVPPPTRLPRPLSIEGHARFLASAHVLGGRHQLIGVLFATTGVRFAGMQLARWSQFELRGEIPKWRIQGKGAARRGPKTYEVPLHSRVAPIVRSWRLTCGSADWVLPGGSRAGHVGEQALRDDFREICDLAGLENIVPHMLRHTVASRVLEERHDLREVQELLGHSNAATVQIYTEVTSDRLRDAVESLPA